MNPASTLTSNQTLTPPFVLARYGMPVLAVIMLGALTGSELLAQAPLKPAKAAVYSIVLPGLGHRYANEGRWNRRAALYTITDAVLIAGLISSEWQRRHLEESYQTWATSYAGIAPAGKDRRFYVTIGNYLSSDEYQETQLRQRRVDLVAYVSDPEFQWRWSRIEDLQRYRDLRKNSESWSQRRGSFIAALVANRLVAALSALITTRRKRDRMLQVAIVPGPAVHIALTL